MKMIVNMFNNTWYTKTYYQIINRAIEQNRKRYSKLDLRYTYYERHHIIPKSLGGENNNENLVLLTARENFVCHQLLIKMCPGNYKLIFAAQMMTVDSNGERVNNRLYEWIKHARAAVPSPLKGKKNPGVSKAMKGGTPWNKGKKGAQQAWNKGLLGYNLGKPSKKAKPVLCVELGITFKHAVEAADYVGLKCNSDINRVARGITKSAGGYTWKFVKQD